MTNASLNAYPEILFPPGPKEIKHKKPELFWDNTFPQLDNATDPAALQAC